MFAMISTLWTASGLNKLWPYLVVGLTVMGSLILAYAQGRSSGSANAKGKQLQDSLNRIQQEAKTRATISSIDSSIARKQLRERWSSK